MFDKIVVPLDGSELAEVALPYAEELVRRMRSKLVLLAVCDKGEREQRQAYLDQTVELIWKRDQKYRARHPEMSLHHPYVDTAILTGTGTASEAIVDYVEYNDAHLTMMATHGRSGIGRWAMGSVADKVVRGVSRPVCLIRAKGTEAQVQPDCLVSRILTPLDGSDAGESALPFVEALALKLKTELVLFQALPKQDRSDDVNWMEIRKLQERNAGMYLRRVQGNLTNGGIAARTVIEFGENPAELIIEAAIRTRSAVIAMSTHGRTGVNRMVFGSVAEKVLRAGTVPLLLVRAALDGEAAQVESELRRTSYSKWSTTTESFV